MNEQQRIGELIKKSRIEKNISQGKLAKLLSVQNPVIYKYENGLIKTIPFDKRIVLSSILDIDINDLLYKQERETTFVDSTAKLKIVYDAFMTAKEQAIRNSLNACKDISLMEAVYKIGYMAFDDKTELEDENLKKICYEEFLKRGLSENDALDLAKFFAWLCIKQPQVLSQWHDIMLKEKLDTENK